MEPGEDREGGLRKRHRSRNFTKYEKEVFYSVFGHYAALINDKGASVDTVRDAWSRLLLDYNSQHNVYPRTRRQLQVLWRDEKFRAKKRCRNEQVDSGGADEDRAPAGMGPRMRCEDRAPATTGPRMRCEEQGQTDSLLTPLLTIIKREQHEDFMARESAATSPDPHLAADAGSASPDAAYARSSSPGGVRSSPSPGLCINANPEDGPVSPLPVETQMDSSSSSWPGEKVDPPEDSGASPPASGGHYGGGNMDVRSPDPSWRQQAHGAPVTTSYGHQSEREYHRVRLAQLREEGAARLRVLEAELALHHHHRQMLQQQHQLKMQILMLKLKRAKEGSPTQ
ncbi:uncharacterized protein [Procambarus clarkii]|uniref:uncharacterized protein n=1 Tax=Procambarus clarkii TaxID=6728 RepID=UPI001E678482|nr:uncharacterized protein LOC123772965 [Procambarus clarkii]